MTIDSQPLLPPFDIEPPVHGADLEAASLRYGIALDAWLDLSTGINPRGYPIAAIDVDRYRQLPHGATELLVAAQDYCAAPALPVAAAGSQVLIQWLPLVRTQATQRCNRIAVPRVGYSEHAFRWQWARHELVYYDARSPAAIEQLLRDEKPDVLVTINAHNPFGIRYEPERLLAWHAQLAASGGWLIVDEAFIDATPASSVAAHTQLPGLIVLRSLGKFFGLAGVRCGFALCEPRIARALSVAVGPWSVGGPAQSIATQALRDSAWQRQMRAELPAMAAGNAELLGSAPLLRNRKCWQHALFNSIELAPSQAVEIEDQLARAGIRVRRIEVDNMLSLLRFGLVDPLDVANWQRCEQALQSLA
jgi:cobalamin biosynthetic protein CobC